MEKVANIGPLGLETLKLVEEGRTNGFFQTAFLKLSWLTGNLIS